MTYDSSTHTPGELEELKQRLEAVKKQHESAGMLVEAEDIADRAIVIAVEREEKMRFLKLASSVEQAIKWRDERDQARADARKLCQHLAQEHRRWMEDSIPADVYPPDEIEKIIESHYEVPGCLHCQVLADTAHYDNV